MPTSRKRRQTTEMSPRNEASEKSSRKKKKQNFTKEQKRILIAKLISRESNPYPPDDEKKEVARISRLEAKQVCNFYINARRRDMETVEVEEDGKKVLRKRVTKKHEKIRAEMANKSFKDYVRDFPPKFEDASPSTPASSPPPTASPKKSRVLQAQKKPTRGRKLATIKETQSPAVSSSIQRNSSVDSGAGDSLSSGASTPSFTFTLKKTLDQLESNSSSPLTTSGLNSNNDAPLKPSLRWRMNHEQELRKPSDLFPCSPSSSTGDNSNLIQEIQPTFVSTPSTSHVSSSIEASVIRRAAPQNEKSHNVQLELQYTPLSREHDSSSCTIQTHIIKSHPESSPSSPISSSTDSDMEVSEINLRAEMARQGKSHLFQHVDNNHHTVSITTTTIEKVFIPSTSNANIATVPMNSHPLNSTFYPDLSHRPILFPPTPNPTPTPMSLTTTTTIIPTSVALNPAASSFSPSLRSTNADANHALVNHLQSIELLPIQHQSHWRPFPTSTSSNSKAKEPQCGSLDMLASVALEKLKELENSKSR